MKVSVKQYAQSLFELVAGKSEGEAKALIAKFIDHLKRRHDLDKADAIIAELGALFDQSAGEIAVELTSARPLTPAARKQIIAFMEKKMDKATVKLEEKIDPALLGGFVVRYNGMVIDGSLKNNLLKFKKQLSN